MTVLPEDLGAGEGRRRRRFLYRAARAMRSGGVPTEPCLRTGPIVGNIIEAVTKGGHDLLVLGAPLPDSDGAVAWSGIGPSIVSQVDCPVLVVRYDNGESCPR